MRRRQEENATETGDWENDMTQSTLKQTLRGNIRRAER